MPHRARRHPRKAALRIAFVRHGESDGLRRKVIQGQSHALLLGEGFEQLAAMGRRIDHRSRVLIDSSPLTRCVQSATAFADDAGLSVRRRPDLRERHVGVLSGRSKEEVARDSGVPWVPWEERSPDFAAPGAGSESTNDLIVRMLRYISGTDADWDPDGPVTIFAFTHVGPMSALAGHLIRRDPKRPVPAPGSMMLLTITDRALLTCGAFDPTMPRLSTRTADGLDIRFGGQATERVLRPPPPDVLTI